MLLHSQHPPDTEVLIKQTHSSEPLKSISYSDPGSHFGQVAPWLTKQLLKVIRGAGFNERVNVEEQEDIFYAQALFSQMQEKKKNAPSSVIPVDS